MIAPIVASSPHTATNLALLGDKMLLFNPTRTAFVMYATHGRSWVALGDPAGPEPEQPELVWRFRELCDQYAGWSVFYQIGHDTLPMYLDLGLTLLKLGEEARVPIQDFSLTGRHRKALRHAHSRAAEEKCSFQVVPVSDVPALLPALRTISDVWLAEKHATEKGFSLGYFDESYLRRFPIALVHQKGKPLAFANLWLGARKEELSIDLMRYVPSGPSNLMDYLFIELMLWGKEQGYQWFNLGMAPLSGIADRPLAPLWNRVAGLAYRHGDHFYGFEGLRQYKEKFDPVWQPKYLASPGGLALPRILSDVAALIRRGPRSA